MHCFIFAVIFNAVVLDAINIQHHVKMNSSSVVPSVWESYSIYPKLRCKGIDGGCCTALEPCELGDGDCDTDAQCKGSLQCGVVNCPGIWPENDMTRVGDDCCESDLPQFCMTFLSGDGAGGVNVQVADADSQSECVQNVKNSEPNANGVTFGIPTGNYQGHCYAEFDMVSKTYNRHYETCLLEDFVLYKSKKECSGPLSYKGYLRSKRECADACFGQAFMFAYGLVDKRCVNGKCRCYCYLQAQVSSCDTITNTGYDLFRFTQHCPRVSLYDYGNVNSYEMFSSIELMKFPVSSTDRLAHGYSISGKLGSPFIFPISVEEIPSADTSLTKSFLVKDEASRYKFLNVAASAEGGGLGLKVSASAKFFQETHMTESSVTYLIVAVIPKVNKRIINPSNLKLTESAKQLLVSNPSQFLKTYGPYYIGSITYGGTFIGSFSLLAKDASQVKDLQAAAEVSYEGGFWSAKGSVQFQDRMKQESSHIRKEADHKILGGIDDGVQSQWPEDMMTKYRTWMLALNKGRTNPMYLHVERWSNSQDIQTIVNSREWIDKHGQTTLNRFVSPPKLLERTGVVATTERMSTQLIIRVLTNMEDWPSMTKKNLEDLKKIKVDAQKYLDEYETLMDDNQLFALQKEMVYNQTDAVVNSFDSWLYCQNNITTRYRELMKKVVSGTKNLCQPKYDSPKRLIVFDSPYEINGRIETSKCVQLFGTEAQTDGVIIDHATIQSVHVNITVDGIIIACTSKIYPYGCLTKDKYTPGFCNNDAGLLGWYVKMLSNTECIVQERRPYGSCCTQHSQCLSNMCGRIPKFGVMTRCDSTNRLKRQIGDICRGDGDCSSKDCRTFGISKGNLTGFCW